LVTPLVEELEPLFNPHSVAVVGATNNWNKWGFSTLSSVLNGFKGEIYPVNQREDQVIGLRAYRRVTDIPGPVDLAVFVIPAPAVPAVMEDCVAKGVKAGVIITAGFMETGEEGRRLQDEVVRIARKGNIRFIGPNCMGYWSASANLRAFMAPLLVEDGPLALVSQGGNVGGAVVMSGYVRGVGFHRYVSCGAAADIQIEDYIEYFGEDPKVKVILAYIEGLNDGRRFLEKVLRVTKRKPVVVLKPGKTNAAVKAISSHSGALAGTDVVFGGAFKKAGVIRVDSPEELLDVAIGFLTQPLPKGRNVAILTPGGSYGVLCADACASDGLNVIKLPEETIEALDKVFPPRWSRGNPVDPAGDRNFLAYLTAPGKLLRLEDVDALIFMGFGGFSTFASTLSTQSAALPRDLAASPFRGLEMFSSALAGARASRNLEQLKDTIRAGIAAFASTMGVDNPSEIDELSEIITEAVASGKLDTFSAGRPHPVEASLQHEPADGVTAFMGAIVRQYIDTFHKPVITTTFGDQFVRLQDSYYAYPSGDRAARVLVKLAEYREYLERESVLESR